jgi:flagella basal body P-ring formation protein FlgA
MKIIFFLLIFSLNAFTCEIFTKATLIRISNFDKNVIQTKDCPKALDKKILNFFNSSSGVLSSAQLSLLLDKKINLTPNMVRIYRINDLLKTRLKLSFNYNFKDIKNINANQGYISSELENIDIQCSSNCKNVANHNIKIIITSNNQKEIHWISSKVIKKSKVYILNRDVDIHNIALNSNILKKELRDIDKNFAYFDDIQNIHFYKPNKKIAKNSPLLKSDLTPIKLIKSGHKIKVILKSNLITVKSSAIAKQNGNYHDYVDVYNPSTNKSYTGKVVDFNTITVDL